MFNCDIFNTRYRAAEARALLRPVSGFVLGVLLFCNPSIGSTQILQPILATGCLKNLSGQVLAVYQVQENPHSTYPEFGMQVQHPLLPGYDGHATAASRWYYHQHALRDLPWTGTIVAGPQEMLGMQVSLSAENVTQAYLFLYPAHTIVAQATTATNCHGLTMWKGHWVQTDQLGAGVAVADEYIAANPPDNRYCFQRVLQPTGVYEWPHSYTRTFTWGGQGWIVTDTIEKFGASPVLRSILVVYPL